jgi:hypothetical protein
VPRRRFLLRIERHLVPARSVLRSRSAGATHAAANARPGSPLLPSATRRRVSD